MNKKTMLFLILVGVAVNSANGLTLKGQSVFANEDNTITLTIFETGKMMFYRDYNTYDGTYSLINGYLHLYDSSGSLIIAMPCQTSQGSVGLQLDWVDMRGTKLYRKSLRIVKPRTGILGPAN